MKQLREEVAASDAKQKKKLLEEGPNAAYGYGGKFGVQSDRYAFNFYFKKILDSKFGN
jgi:cortactin